MLTREGVANQRHEEWQADSLLMDALGLARHQTMAYLFQEAPTFAEFEDWIVTTAGKPSKALVERINAELGATNEPALAKEWQESIEQGEPVLGDEELECWEVNGYTIVKSAISRENCDATAKVIWDYVNADPDDPASWYQGADHGMMVELIQHPVLQANRQCDRILKAFAQLWKTTKLWVSADRCSFHPPQTNDCPFPGPDLHWDIDFDAPLGFATQGLLYLADTPAEQGALTVVPGFQHKLKTWLQTLPENSDPNAMDLHALGPVPIAGEAGDLVIWHHFLPHGSRPNLGTRPRLVQYINMNPGLA